jgi:hypothetical protein
VVQLAQPYSLFVEEKKVSACLIIGVVGTDEKESNAVVCILG